MIMLISQEEFNNLKSRELIKLECECCHKSFYKEKHYICASLKGSIHKKLKYCSRECRGNAKIRKKIILNCHNCGKEIQRNKSKIQPHNFCCSRCFGIWKNRDAIKNLKYKQFHLNLTPRKPASKTIQKKCLCCNKNIEKTESRIKLSKSGRFFCSKSCRLKYDNKYTIKHKSKSFAESYLFNIIRKDFPTLEIIQNSRNILPNGLEIDIFIPCFKLCIEINGPFHFLPIFGIEKLKNTQNRDMRKQLEINKLKLNSIMIDISKLTCKSKTKEFLNDYYQSKIKSLLVAGEIIEISGKSVL